MAVPRANFLFCCFLYRYELQLHCKPVVAEHIGHKCFAPAYFRKPLSQHFGTLSREFHLSPRAVIAIGRNGLKQFIAQMSCSSLIPSPCRCRLPSGHVRLNRCARISCNNPPAIHLPSETQRTPCNFSVQQCSRRRKSVFFLFHGFAMES